MEKKRAGVRRGGGREAQHDLLRLLLEHAERALGVGLQVEVRRRRAGLLEDLKVMDRIEAEQRRLAAALDAGDQVGARPEQQAVGDDLAPARRAPIVELDHEPRQAAPRAAVASTAGSASGRGPTWQRQSLGAKLRLDVHAEAAPVGLAQAGADLRCSERKARGAAFLPPPLRGRGRSFRVRPVPRPSAPTRNCRARARRGETAPCDRRPRGRAARTPPRPHPASAPPSAATR